MVTNMTITRKPGNDRYGEPGPGLPETIFVPDVTVAPRTSEELTAGGRAGVVTGYTVYADPGHDVRRHDTAELAGVAGTFEVIGDPAVWDTAGIVVELAQAVG